MNNVNFKKFPFNGKSQNLFEYFLIIGYEKYNIKNEIIPNYFKDPKLCYEPTIINTIISNNITEMLDNDLIMKFVFPHQPSITATSDLNYEPTTTSIIFSCNSDNLNATSKNPFNGFALIFNEAFIHNSTKIFIPKAMCIISQFPYFSFYNYLTKELLNFFKNKTEIPIEILLYNLLNFIPSPINFPLKISPLPYKDISTYTNFRTSVTELKSQTINTQSYSISQLLGYPVLNFNLSDIFNILNINLVVEILIFNFLEIDMIFFLQI